MLQAGPGLKKGALCLKSLSDIVPNCIIVPNKSSTSPPCKTLLLVQVTSQMSAKLLSALQYNGADLYGNLYCGL